jgi:hypothetical protein
VRDHASYVLSWLESVGSLIGPDGAVVDLFAWGTVIKWVHLVLKEAEALTNIPIFHIFGSLRLHDQFTYVFETPYENHNDNQFTCQVDRPQDPPNPQEMMYVMNHFLYGSLQIGSTSIDIPQPYLANTTNGQSLSNHANNCTSVFQRQPNFIEIDFYE